MDKEKLYLAIIDSLREGVYVVDVKKRFVFWNKAAEDIIGYKKEDIIGKACNKGIIGHINKEGRSLCEVGCPLYASMLDGQQRSDEVLLKHKEGHRIPVTVHVTPIVEDGRIVGTIESFTPNSSMVYEGHVIDELTDFAMKDPLTGLPNRRRTENHLKFCLGEMKRMQSKYCVLFLDIDDFSKFNNTYGHDAGDEVLKAVSTTTMHTVRRTDMFGRWGGEEFVGVFEVKQDCEAVLIAEKIRALIENSTVQHCGQSLSVTASLGVTTARADDTIDSVVKRADALMYQSKQAGKDRVTTDIIEP